MAERQRAAGNTALKAGRPSEAYQARFTRKAANAVFQCDPASLSCGSMPGNALTELHALSGQCFKLLQARDKGGPICELRCMCCACRHMPSG